MPGRASARRMGYPDRHMPRILIGGGLAAALLFASCETAVAPLGGNSCAPGSTAPCSCGGTQQGTETCLASETFGACVCSTSTGGSSSGGTSSGGSSSGGMDAGQDDAGPEDAGVCIIAGTSYESGELDFPFNDCLACSPADTASAWTPVADGTSCVNEPPAVSGVCLSGSCSTTVCYIGTTLCASGAQNPANSCEACDPSSSQTSWTSVDGVPCDMGGGNVCVGGACQAGCYFTGTDGCSTFSGGVFYAPGAAQPCQVCSVCAVECPLGDAGLCLGEWTWELDGTACGSAGEVCQQITPYTTATGAVVSEGCGVPQSSSSSGGSSSGGTSSGGSSGGMSSSSSSGGGGDGEGTLCTPVSGDGTSNCPNGLACANWSPYVEGYYVCRVPCSQGCPSGEVCTQDVGSATTASCQCTPAEAPGDPGDSCAPFGLICHPDFRVCLAAETPADCPDGGPLIFSTLWSLCLAD